MNSSFSSSDVAKLFLEVVPDAMREYREEMRKCRGNLLSVPQFRILAMLWQGPANNKELAEFQGASVAAMSRMVEVLVLQGLIERQVHPRDRRQVTLLLTASGQAAFKAIRRRALDNFQEKFRDLTPQDLRRLGAGLESLRAVMTELKLKLEDSKQEARLHAKLRSPEAQP